MRIAVLFLAGMAFVTGFNQRAQKLDKRSKEMIPAATAEEFVAYRERWRANLLASRKPLPWSEAAAANDRSSETRTPGRAGIPSAERLVIGAVQKPMN